MKGRALSDEDKDAVLAAIGQAWKAQPEMRLGQLITLWATRAWGAAAPGSVVMRGRILDGLFFAEDGDLAHGLLGMARRQEEP